MLEQAIDEGRANTNLALVLPTLLRGPTRTRELALEFNEGLIFQTLVAGGDAGARTARNMGALVRDRAPDQELQPDQSISPKAPADGIVDAQEISITFDGTNPEAVRWAETESATQITNIDRQSRMAVTIAIRSLLAESFVAGIPTRKLARMIRPLIGLLPRDAAAVANLRKRLTKANGGTLVKAGKVRIRVPPGGASAALIDKATNAYSTRLLNARALNIARTETIRASNEGLRQLWNQNRAAGLLTGNEKKVWIVTPDNRLCPVCAGIAGQLRGVNEFFDTGSFGLVMTPPAHPSCRCAMGLVKPRA